MFPIPVARWGADTLHACSMIQVEHGVLTGVPLLPALSAENLSTEELSTMFFDRFDVFSFANHA